MNVKEMHEYLCGLSKLDEGHTDTLKCGSWYKELNKIAVTMLGNS